MRQFGTVLVANRGEIAVRVIRTLRHMGIRSVAVYSDADRDSRHAAEADMSVRIGPSNAAESYLSTRRILDAAHATGAEAVHPGYGFLSESGDFDRACAEAGIAFLGPPASAIEAMGDKIRAKQTVSANGVPVVPGSESLGMSDEDIRAAAATVGYPVLLKPSAGGGGKGMRTVFDAAELDDRITSARREAQAAFGDDTLLVERFLNRPRHVEVQILADAHDTVVHLGERECSLQRRHQKIVEEAPSPLLDDTTRERIGAAAVRAAWSVGYVGAGTVEFIVSADRPDEFFFMEMNTRLQVEHPVTELVTTVGGDELDLVEWQVRVAEGEALPFGQEDVRVDGHAVEARVYAEDPASGFLPSGGRVLDLQEPSGPGVRVDSGLSAGMHVGSDYDPMLAKVLARGANRGEALRRLDAALADTAVLGLSTNTTFLRRLLRHPDVRAGRLDTGLVERDLDELTSATGIPDEVFAAAALERLLVAEPAGAVVDPWDTPGGWRLGEPATSTFRFAGPDGPVPVRVRGRAVAAEVAVGDGDPVPASASADGPRLTVTLGNRTDHYRCARGDDTTWLAAGGHTWSLAEHQLLAAGRQRGATSDGQVKSPMPGTVLVTDVIAGQAVTEGQKLFVVEAMKMEHTITAPFDGSVTHVHVHKGQSVGIDEPLAALTTDDKGN